MSTPTWPEQLISALCDLLREKRLELGVSIYRVSQVSGVSQIAISNYEKHIKRPTLECLIKVSGGLGLTPVEIIQLAQKRVGPPPKREVAAPVAKKTAKHPPKGKK